MNTLKSLKRKSNRVLKRSLKSKTKIPLFIHIPKTAGSSIEEILYLNNYKESRPQKALKKYASVQILKREYSDLKKVSKYHLPLSVYQSSIANKIKNNYHLFAVVRNPYERIISDFRFWVSQFYPEHHQSSIHRNRNLCLEIKDIIPDLKINSENLNLFVHHVLGEKHYNFSVLDGHLIPMNEYTHKKINKHGKKRGYIPVCDILRFENLDEDFNKLIKKLELNIPLNSTKTTVHNKSRGQTLTLEDLDHESLKLIKKRYILDFKLFKYSYLKD